MKKKKSTFAMNSIKMRQKLYVYYKAYQSITFCVISDRSGAAKRSSLQAARTVTTPLSPHLNDFTWRAHSLASVSLSVNQCNRYKPWHKTQIGAASLLDTPDYRKKIGKTILLWL